MNAEERVRTFLIESRRWSGAPEELTLEYPLIENDVLDSMGIFELIAFLEDSFDLRVADDDLVPENFETVAAIGRLVELSKS